ncbi:hypothetical protein G9A89_009064 [Geosiphon pyriformis]|nr:hypothetical protein G9A89_009064 [Geosiphon pyriformis]
MVIQKDTENGTRNCALLVENHYQKGTTEITYQAEEEHVTQLANTQSLSVTGCVPLAKNRNSILFRLTLTFAKTVLSCAKVSVVKSVNTKRTWQKKWKLRISTDKTQWIKIPITNITEELIYIPENTIIKYLGTELENALTLQKILNFPEIALYYKLTLINWQQLLECYQFMPEKLAKLNIGTMDLDQQ